MFLWLSLVEEKILHVKINLFYFKKGDFLQSNKPWHWQQEAFNQKNDCLVQKRFYCADYNVLFSWERQVLLNPAFCVWSSFHFVYLPYPGNYQSLNCSKQFHVSCLFQTLELLKTDAAAALAVLDESWSKKPWGGMNSASVHEISRSILFYKIPNARKFMVQS